MQLQLEQAMSLVVETGLNQEYSDLVNSLINNEQIEIKSKCNRPWRMF